MKKQVYRVIGVMSGTSLDGIDLCYAQFEFDGQWHFQIIEADTLPYTSQWRTKLSDAIHLSREALLNFDVEYSRFLSGCIHSFIEEKRIKAVDFIASHGHTIHHRPHEQFTYQVGNRAEILDHLDCPVVCDFRAQDVAMGGEGAPLVPIGDRLLFGEYAACLNLGGFANISFEDGASRLAFDICPVNVGLNHLARRMDLDYDDGGAIASSGQIIKALYNDLNALNYYTLKPPKSLGIEWVNQSVFPLLDQSSGSIEDKLTTLSCHIADQLGTVINTYGFKSVCITGGGAYNTYLINQLKMRTDASLIRPDTAIVDFKEALIFALLGILRVRGEVNCLKSVTGANRDHSSGVLYGF